ncbi:MAG TPA: acylphosphatase [Opitutaceae bacterium]
MGNVHHELIWFSGHVQGVGFRYSTVQVAKEFEVSGFVQNLADGRVLVEAEGEKPEIDRFVKAVEERMHGHVRKTERRSESRAAAFSGFIIR